MKALTWQGRQSVRVEEVADPVIQEPTDAIIKVTSTAICGSDLHLYSVLGPFLSKGDVLGHETMGVVEEVGAEVTHVRPGDRVVRGGRPTGSARWLGRRVRPGAGELHRAVDAAGLAPSRDRRGARVRRPGGTLLVLAAGRTDDESDPSGPPAVSATG